ncbi:MAG: hypothetical protein V3S06_00005 [candidate division Zixibacteria bacterium]
MNARDIIRRNWPYLYFLLLTATVFAGFIFSDKMLFGSDTVEAGLFFRGFYAEFVKVYHRIPLWNPYIFGGLPFIDAMHGDTFYPLAILQFIMPLHKALGYKLVLAVLMAGIFTYLYLREMKMSIWAAVFGGTAYMLSGFMVSLVYAGHDGRMYVTGLLPLLLFTLEIGFRRRQILWWWPFSAAFGLLILANHPQFSYFAMWCIGAYFVLKLIVIYRKSGRIGSVIIPGSGFIVAMFFGLALGLVQIWPAQDYVRNYSPRSGEGRGYQYAASWSLHSEEAISQVVPGFAGLSNLQNHPSLTREHTYWGKNYFKINSEYAGMVALYLGLAGLFLYRDRYSYFFMGTAAFALLYALGDSGLIFKFFYHFVPFVNKFRAPSTIMFLFSFSIAFLAARTVDTLQKTKNNPRAAKVFRWLLILAGIYLLLGLVFTRAGSGIMKIYTSIFYSNIEIGQWNSLQANLSNISLGLIVGALLLGALAVTFRASLGKKTPFGVMVSVMLLLVMVDSWIMEDMKFIRLVDHKPYFAKPAGISFLQDQDKPFRSFVLPGAMPNQNSLAMFGLEQVAGYHGNQLRWYNQFLGDRFSNLFGNPSALALTNARFLIIQQEVNHPNLDLVKSVGGVYIYQNKFVIPRGRIIYDYTVVSDPDSALSLILHPDFDHFKRIVIDRRPSVEIRAPESIQTDSVQFLDSPPDRIRVRAHLSAPGFLVLQDNWYPHWKAFEGGKEYPVYRTDFTFMAVELPAGEHLLEFRVENPNYLHARTVSKISWTLLIIGIATGLISKTVRRRKKDSQPAPSN